MATKDKTHFVSGSRNIDGTFTTVCPHKATYEYINGFAYRMVGSAVCRSCKHYLDKNKYKVMSNEFSIKCGHPGTDVVERKASILKINF